MAHEARGVVAMQRRLNLDGFAWETIDVDDIQAAFDRMESGDVLRSVAVL